MDKKGSESNLYHLVMALVKFLRPLKGRETSIQEIIHVLELDIPPLLLKETLMIIQDFPDPSKGREPHYLKKLREKCKQFPAIELLPDGTIQVYEDD